MEFTEQYIQGVWVIQPKRFGDARGYFSETFKKDEFQAHVGAVEFVQDNESFSSYGVLRGLHFQKGEFSQAKLVRVSRGRVLDVAVDLRGESPTFGKHVAVELSAELGNQLYIPRGFAHGRHTPRATIMKAICEIVEKASTRLISLCAQATAAA